MNQEFDWLKLAEEFHKSALDDLCEILAIPSVLDEYRENSNIPFGLDNQKCLEKFLSFGIRDGFVVKNVKNYAGHIAYGDGPDIVGILGHLDVVPAEKGQYEPFIPIITDGKLYARGAVDDKGPVMACYCAFKILSDLKIKLKNQIRLIIGCDEESGSRCLKKYFESEDLPFIGFSPDAEFPLIYGEKGIYSFKIKGKIRLENIKEIKCGTRFNIVPDYAKVITIQNEVREFFGKSAHAMSPDKGINAGVLALDYLGELTKSSFITFLSKNFDIYGKKLKLDFEDNEMGRLTFNMAFLNYENNEIEIGFNLRLPKDENKIAIDKKYRKICDKYKLIFEEVSYSPTHYISPDSNLVKTLLGAYQSITNDKVSAPFTIGGGTYAKMLPNCAAFGPSFLYREDVIHKNDEYMYVEDFIKQIAIYTKAIYELGML